MLAAVLVLAASVLDAPRIADYFPLTPGTSWVYEDSEGKLTSRFEDRVGESVAIEGKPAWPISSWVDGQMADTVYYRHEDDAAVLVAYDAKKPLVRPYAILKIGSGKSTWSFDGTTSFMGEPAPMRMTGESRPGRTLTVLGTKRPTVQVSLEATIDGGPTIQLKSKQSCVYAQGVGLVEMRETVTVGKKTTERRRRLISYRQGVPGG